MEKPKQPNIFRRHRGRGFGERKPKAETRQTRQNFWRRAASSGPPTRQHTKVPFQKRVERSRAKNKRSRAARKANR